MTFYTQVQKLKYLSQCQVILLQFEVYKENTFLLYFFESEHNSFIFPEFTLLVPVKQECNKWQPHSCTVILKMITARVQL